MQKATRKKILFAVIVLVALVVVLRMFGILRDVTAVVY
jgi:hypothetical protein